MQHLIKHQPSFPLLQVNLAPNEVVIAEAGTMVARSTTLAMDVRLNAGARAGFFGKLKATMIALVRKLVGGDTFFVNHFSSPGGGWVWLAPALSGSIVHLPLAAGQRVTLTAGAFIACTGEIDLKMRWGGLRAIFSKEGLFFVEASGPGEVWVSSYGAVDEIWVNGSYVVDNGHLVAFDTSLDFSIKTPGGGLMGFIASGEGLVCEFTGQGRVFIQSRNTNSLVDWVSRLLP
jgi:uncharacterized protein (TIGR00266 family)